MTNVTTKPDSSHPTGETAVYLFDNWFDPIEGGVRDRVREFIQKDQNADRAAIGRYRRDVILGAACLRPDQHAQDRWLADARHKAHRSTD